MNKLAIALTGLFTFVTTFGSAQALFAIPVDEPATLALFSIGLVAIVARRFLRK